MRKKKQFFYLKHLIARGWSVSDVMASNYHFYSTTQLFRSHLSMTPVTSRPMLLFYSQSSLWKRKTFHSDRPWNVHFCLLVELRLPRIDNSTWSRRRRRERCQPSGPATPVQRVSNAADKIERVAGSDGHEWPSRWRLLIDFSSLLLFQTSGRSSPDSDVADVNTIRPVESISIHKLSSDGARCSTCEGKGKSEGFSGAATLPAKFNTKCPECCEPLDAHQTLDLANMKRFSKIRPTILSPDCDSSDNAGGKQWPTPL